MNHEAASEGAPEEIPADLPTLGEPAPPPATGEAWRLEYGSVQGTKTNVSVVSGSVLLHHEALNVASHGAREKFARAAIKAARLEIPDLMIESDEIIAQLVAHSAMSAATPPSPLQNTSPDRPKIANHEFGVALDLAAIDVQIAALAPDWPKRFGDHLFVTDPKGVPEYLDSWTRLFSWMDELARVDWAVGPTMITEARYHAHLLRHAERHEGIVVMPHQPPIPGIYYMTPKLPGATESTGALDEFVSFFCPETPLDRALIKAMAMTPSWGGPHGGRPAFLVTSPDGAKKKGTGRGKSTLVQRISELHGGSVSVDQGMSIETLKTRLLSPAASSVRCLAFDNVKSHKLSWGALEGLITEQVISGRENYVGEGRRPNTLTTLITLNGARLSTDLARRVVTIVLGLPKARATWEDELSKFLAARRWHVIADIRSILASDPLPLESRINYAPWESAVLAHVDDPEACQALILRRREKIDADEDETDAVLGMFLARLQERGHVPELAHVLVSKAEVAGWLSEATRERFTTATATNHIKMLSISQLSERRLRTGVYWVWRGEQATSEEPKPINASRYDDGRPLPTKPDRERWRALRDAHPDE
jgi:hypothetical protein